MGGASPGGAGGASAGTGGASAGTGGGGAGGAGMGEVKSKGCGAMRTLQDGSRTIQSGGTQRTYTLRVPADYDNKRAYRLILSFHGAGGRASDVAPSYFGLWELAQGTTIFAAPDAAGDRTWKPATDTPLVEDMIEQITGDLCIDTSRIVAEGFSHGGAFTWTLACALPDVFQAAVVHSGGGMAMPQTCKPIPFFSALGTDGSGQNMSSDYFAKVNGCTVESLPEAPKGGHACTNYKNCSPGFPTRWCDYDAGHTPSAVDAGQTKSWVPQEVWTFLTQL
jgi:pimeloyl-ACP methyl ester carboxylesterase